MLWIVIEVAEMVEAAARRASAVLRRLGEGMFACLVAVVLVLVMFLVVIFGDLV